MASIHMPKAISGTQFAELIGVTERRIRQLIDLKIIHQKSRGRYEIGCVAKYCEHLRDLATKRTGGRAASEEKTRRQIRLLDLEIAERESELVKLSEVREEGIRVGAMLSAQFHEMLNDLPGRLAGLSEIEVRQALRQRFGKLESEVKAQIAKEIG